MLDGIVLLKIPLSLSVVHCSIDIHVKQLKSWVVDYLILSLNASSSLNAPLVESVLANR